MIPSLKVFNPLTRDYRLEQGASLSLYPVRPDRDEASTSETASLIKESRDQLVSNFISNCPVDGHKRQDALNGITSGRNSVRGVGLGEDVPDVACHGVGGLLRYT